MPRQLHSEFGLARMHHVDLAVTSRPAHLPLASRTRLSPPFKLVDTMASLARTGLLRHSQLMLGARSMPAPSRFSAQAIRATSILSRQPASSMLATVPRFAPFSTSTQKKIMPPGPQVIDGGVNDPAPVPKSNPIHGSYHWTFERLVSIGLIPLTLAPFAAGTVSPAIDASLVLLLIIHSHMGFRYAYPHKTARAHLT